jgi:hypothetical protein
MVGRLRMPQVGIGNLVDHLLHGVDLTWHHAHSARREVMRGPDHSLLLCLLGDHGHPGPHHLLRRLKAVVGHTHTCCCCSRLLLLLVMLHSDVLGLHLQLLLPHHLLLLHALLLVHCLLLLLLLHMLMMLQLLLHRIHLAGSAQLPRRNGHL